MGMSASLRKLALIGAGEHAAVVAEAAAAGGWSVLGAIVQAAPDASLAHLGTDADLPGCLPADCGVILAMVGAPRSGVRRDLCGRLGAGLPWTTIIHPSAVVSPSAVLGQGVFVAAGAIINAGAVIGDHAVINTAAVVEHHTLIGAGAHLAPRAVVGGGVRVGPWSWIGLGAVVRDHRSIGAGAVVGMGSVVVADVADSALVLGVPARNVPS